MTPPSDGPSPDAGGPVASGLVLRRDGRMLVLDAVPSGAVVVLHLGADLGPDDAAVVAGLRATVTPHERNNAFDDPSWLGLLPAEADGWLGPQGIGGHRDGRVLLPRLRARSAESDGATATLVLADDDQGVEVRAELAFEPGGLLRLRHTLTNTGDGVLDLSGLAVLLPLRADHVETLDLAGKWSRERSPQRHRLDVGTRLRETRRGRTGHDAPTVLVAGTEGFGFRHGTVLGVHLGWSGHSAYRAELRADPAANAEGVLGAAELLEAGEVRLAGGESYATPWVYAAWSDEGLDGLAASYHRYLRSRAGHPTAPRPVVLNIWEAVYFDHSLPKLLELAELASAVGVERFVVDDGWFRHRRDDHAGLGDWYVDEGVWPDGFAPLFDRVRELGMQVGLWFEPEMVNPDSDLARAHPEWMLAAPGRTPMPSRHQQVLDLGRPEVSAYLLERLDAIIGEYAIDFVKWDHNRDLSEAVHAPTGQYGVHRQTEALYALLDELRRRHPSLEIESCSSGGARVDLGILQRTDRVWTSDSNDAVERQLIQRWTAQLLPPELLGSHVGPYVAHTSGRAVDLPMRLVTALPYHFGFEWDITTCTPEEVAAITAAVTLHKELRGLLHSGDLVRADLPDDGVYLSGVVAADRREAVFTYARVVTSSPASPGRVVLPGLDPATAYDVRVRLGGPMGDLTGVPGSVLGSAGLQVPILGPAQAVLLHLTAH